LVFTDILSLSDTAITTDTARDTALSIATTDQMNKGSESSAGSDSLWGIFIAGLIGGFAAFLMPCIYPMVPLTTSFFTKQSGSRSRGLQMAFLYGLSIVVIYVALGMLITLLFGASA